MTKKPLVTVVCLCYNHGDFILNSLQSIISQSYKNTEIIIIDDFSSDDSVDKITSFVKNYPSITTIFNTSNIGNTKSFNKALKIAKGSLIIDLSTDDILLPKCIETQVSFFVNTDFSSTFLVYGNAEIISEDNKHLGYIYPLNELGKTAIIPFNNDCYQDILNQKYSMNSASSIFNTSLLRELNGYDEDLVYEDLDIWIRGSRNYNFYYIDDVLVQKRKLSNSLGLLTYNKPQSVEAKKFSYSTYKIFKKALTLNRLKSEDYALLRRVHYEMEKNFRNGNFIILFKLIIIELKLRFRKI